MLVGRHARGQRVELGRLALDVPLPVDLPDGDPLDGVDGDRLVAAPGSRQDAVKLEVLADGPPAGEQLEGLAQIAGATAGAARRGPIRRHVARLLVQGLLGLAHLVAEPRPAGDVLRQEPLVVLPLHPVEGGLGVGVGVGGGDLEARFHHAGEVPFGKEEPAGHLAGRRDTDGDLAPLGFETAPRPDDRFPLPVKRDVRFSLAVQHGVRRHELRPLPVPPVGRLLALGKAALGNLQAADRHAVVGVLGDGRCRKRQHKDRHPTLQASRHGSPPSVTAHRAGPCKAATSGRGGHCKAATSGRGARCKAATSGRGAPQPAATRCAAPRPLVAALHNSLLQKRLSPIQRY